MEHHAQSVDDALIGGLSYRLKPGASYVTDRRKSTFFASGGNQYSSSGVKVCKFNIVSDHWLDPSTFRVMFTVNNLGDTASVETRYRVKPLHWNPAVFFRRCRLIAGGVVIEDIDDFNRLSLMLTALKPVDDQKEISMEGFAQFGKPNDSVMGEDNTNWGTFDKSAAEDADERKAYRVSDWDEANSIHVKKTVMFKPLLGLFNQEKLIPLRYCSIQIELELVSNSSDCVYLGPYGSDMCIDNWSISDIQCKCDLLTLDSSLQNEYASHLLSGKTLPINFSTFNHTNQSTNGDKNFNANIQRALTRLKSVFITLFKDAGNGLGPAEVKYPGMRKVCNDFYHPASTQPSEDLEVGQHQVWLQVGSKLYPEYPMRDDTEAFYQLRQTVGHPIHMYSRWYHTVKYIIGIDMEKISGAGFTGTNTKAGELLTINFRDCINKSLDWTIPSRMYCALHYDAVLNIKDSGCELLD
jgi:hypothetical protein